MEEYAVDREQEEEQDELRRKIASPRLQRIFKDRPNVFDYLNEDCLVEIFSHLDIPTTLNVAEADHRFTNAVRRRYAQERELTIDEAWIEMAQSHTTHMRDFYSESAKGVSFLCLQSATEETIAEIIQYYEKLEFLSLSKVKINSQETMDLLPKQLKRLHLDRCHIKQTFLENWFEDLNESLRVLHYLSNYIEICFDALPKLKHMENLVIDGRCFLVDNLKEFLDVNYANLRHFELRNYDADIDQVAWKSLTKCSRLKVLVLDITSIQPEVESREMGLFPELEVFNVQVRLQHTNTILTQFSQILDSFGCENTLKRLSCGEVRGSYITKFKNLEELEIQEDFLDIFTCLLDLTCLKRLRFLVFNFLALNEDDGDLLELIKELPELKKLILHECLLSETFFDRLKIYLASVNRVIEITSDDVVESTVHLIHTPEVIIDMDSDSDSLVNFGIL